MARHPRVFIAIDSTDEAALREMSRLALRHKVGGCRQGSGRCRWRTIVS